jgi:hypothetical protein
MRVVQSPLVLVCQSAAKASQPRCGWLPVSGAGPHSQLQAVQKRSAHGNGSSLRCSLLVDWPVYPRLSALCKRRSGRQSISQKGMLQVHKRLGHGFEDKPVALEVERSVAAMNSPVMVRANEHEVPKNVGTTPAKPADVVGFA